MRLDQAKDRSIQQCLETSSKYCILVQFDARSEERIAILSNTITRNRSLQHTACDCIEKAVRMKTKEEGYLKVCLTPRLPRAVLKPNSRSSQQDQQEQDARSSCDHPCGSKGSGETWCNNVDNRIPGIPHSAVKQQDTNRRDTVKKLIQQFESHPNKESILQDFKQTEKINKFSEKSQELIAEMNNTEIFELCGTSSEKQCPDCKVYWEIGIVYGTCGRCSKNRRKELRSSTRTTTTFYQFLAVLSKKNGARRCQTWTFRAAANVLQGYGKFAKSQPKHGGHRSILERWHKDAQYRKSLSEIGWTWEQIIGYDKIALKDHSYVATRSEIIQNSKHWILNHHINDLSLLMQKENAKDCTTNT